MILDGFRALWGRLGDPHWPMVEEERKTWNLARVAEKLERPPPPAYNKDLKQLLNRHKQ